MKMCLSLDCIQKDWDVKTGDIFFEKQIVVLAETRIQALIKYQSWYRHTEGL